MQYRAEIDGLRAVAVLPVMLFHAGISGFDGGFIGVDIFFVISGYLISTIIWLDLEQNKFSFANFYERRARRILPALFIVIAVCIPFAWALLPPDKLMDFARSALSTLFFVSNHYFYDQAGYFGAAAETLPLLHTWSLAVEEQFYLLFPVVLILLHRRSGRRKTMATLAFIALVSFALCEIGWRTNPDANFFLAPFRAWELMIGAMCGLALQGQPGRSNPSLSILGLVMILASIVFLDEHTPFPSFIALLPVVGTALVILFSHQDNLSVKFLSFKPLVALGLISYSAYLWHQPVLVFARAMSISEPTMTAMLTLVMLSLILAWLSWHYIEKPFRRRSGNSNRNRLHFAMLAGGGVSLAAFALAAVFANGFSNRFEPRSIAAYQAGLDRPTLLDSCKLGYAQTKPVFCQNGEINSPVKRIALIGDSHASQWSASLAAQAQPRKWRVDTFAKSACPTAMIDFKYEGLKRNYHECLKWRVALFEQLEVQPYDLIIIAQSSLGYRQQSPAFAVSSEQWEKGLIRLTGRLDRMGVPWMLLSDNPRFDGIEPLDCAFKTSVLGLADESYCSVSRSEALDLEHRRLEKRLVAASRGGEIIDLADQFCDELVCRPDSNGLLMMSDSNHLSTSGADQLAPLVIAAASRTLSGDTAVQ